MRAQTNGPAFASPQWLANGAFQLTLVGQTGQTYRLQCSRDLDHWSDWTNVILNSPSTCLTDPEASRDNRRFYRAVTVLADQPVPEMVWISPGSFMMGSPESEQDREMIEGPQTQVTISMGFWVGKHEITQGEYQAVLETNPSAFTRDNRLPVETVSWIEATNYCAKLTEHERLAGRLPAGYEYRLPTEAEWEYACRAGTSTRFSYGDDPTYEQLENYAWYSVNSGGETHRVGSKRPNAWGLCDTHGNVWEWCLDWEAPYPGGRVTDPQWPAAGIYRAVRGGGWDLDGSASRSAFRHGFYPAHKQSYLGFRVVLVPALR